MALLQSRRLLFVLILAAVLAAIWLAFRLTPEQRLRESQRDLLELAHAGSADSFLEIAAADYADQWNHQRADVPQKLREVRLATGGIEVTPGEMQIDRNGDEATVRVDLTLKTLGGPGMDAGRMEQCTGVFRWRRNGFWKWELVRVEAEGLNW